MLRKKLDGGPDDRSLMNHSPHHRSQSLMIKRTESPLTDDEGQTHPKVTTMSALVSSALDCAIAGSSSQIGLGLNKLGENDTQKLNTNENHLDGQTDRVRMSPRSSPYFSNRRNGGDPSDTHRLSEMLNSTLLHDHFDQYKNMRDDSGLGRDLGIPEDRAMSPVTGFTDGGHTPDRSPDSGLSDSDLSSGLSRPLQRRKTLPSIVKRDVPKANTAAKVQEAIRSTENLSKEESEIYVIENGIRKRVKAEVHKIPEKFTSNDITTLPSRYKLEGLGSLAKGANRGSLPDITDCTELKKTKTMSRKEVNKLSEQRRQELRLMKEEEERRKEGEIVLRMTDVKVRCSQI